MPLDPIFSDRLNTHRRYLLGQAIDRVKSLLRWPNPEAFRRLPRRRNGRAAARSTPAVAQVSGIEVIRSASGGLKTVEPTPPAAPATSQRQARARKRKAALAWDRKELTTVGIPGPELRTQEHQVAVSGYPAVRVRIYYPDSATAGIVPVCLAFFGGAFRMGGIDFPTTDAAFRRRAAESGVAIAAVDYALAPEHRYPTQVHQGHAALTWLFESAEALGIDPGRVAIAGVSAGGNIAAAVTLMNRERSRLPIRLQLLEVPVVDLTGRHIDLRPTRAMRIPSVLAMREMRSVARTYLARREQAREPWASPLLAESHADLPPAYILTAEYDPLRGDGAAYTAALRRADIDASAVQYLGVTHDTVIFTAVLPAARRWHRDVVEILRSLHD
ncbi:alpha/beta hydrolase [Salinibacterium sp. ZJ454]|uniref:alpha/beta hydrolase n=1 Tax=Salinibacterium sp. ZJ454 TaxID=2708339 RepID=UPI001422DC92|nr:alpha/beta hydrolase [Salinibacterium sp. ZJ454]